MNETFFLFSVRYSLDFFLCPLSTYRRHLKVVKYSHRQIVLEVFFCFVSYAIEIRFLGLKITFLRFLNDPTLNTRSADASHIINI